MRLVGREVTGKYGGVPSPRRKPEAYSAISIEPETLTLVPSSLYALKESVNMLDLPDPHYD